MIEQTAPDYSAAQASVDQLAFAASLGIQLQAGSDANELITQVEDKLGQNTMLEQARWFILSVLRHANQADWNDLSGCDVSDEQQYGLAAKYIANDKQKKSLRKVLKDNRCRFTLIRFAKSRNLEQRKLSTTTKAFKQARQLLNESGLIQDVVIRKSASRHSAMKKWEDASGSVVNRRASRRGYFSDAAPDYIGELDFETAEPNRDHMDDLTEEEYAELEKVIVGDGDRSTQQNWSYPTNDDRLSLLLGLAAGCCVFIIVLWIFL